MSPYQQAIKYLNELFDLPAKGGEQDWDIEMADSGRLNEFIKAFENPVISLAVKQALLSLILASYDEFLDSDPDKDDLYWNQIKNIINNEPHNYQDLLDYWALKDELIDKNIFNITPRVRSYLA